MEAQDGTGAADARSLARAEELTGFDEGFKPHWQEEFRRRGIRVCGPIAVEAGEKVLADYVAAGHPVYRPQRQER